ncbi:MAG TPA: hypothetical protein VKB46_12415 [Pyrinomonadaceae bacterium]|nr:hypothetical protein [Pyrinomonadaceae bacterium]
MQSASLRHDKTFASCARLTGALVALLSLTSVTFATSIVASRTLDEVVIGADSLGTFDNGKSIVTRNVCKIHEQGGVVFAIAGLEVNPPTGFNAATLIATEAAKGYPISETIRAIESVIKPQLLRELEWQQKERPEMYRRRLIDNQELPLSFVLAGLENGSPVLYARAFKIDGTILRVDSPNGEFTLWIGKSAAIERFRAQRNRRLYHSPVEFVRVLVQLEIDDDEPTVAGPIDMVRITRNGTEWLQRKSECK